MKNNNKGFLSLLGMVFALAIICWMAYMVFKAYLLQPNTSTEEKIGSSLSGQGTTTYNVKSIEANTRKTIEDITKQRVKDLEAIKKELGQ